MATLLATREAPTARLVHSSYGRHKAYLEIVPDGNNAILIKPTNLGKKALNRFWTMWLRKLLLEQTAEKRSYGIEVRNNAVRLTGNAPLETMIGTVHHIAAQIYPLNHPPLRQSLVYTDGKQNMRLGLYEYGRAIPWALILSNIELPRRTKGELTLWDRKYSGWQGPGDRNVGYYTIVVPFKHSLSLSQVGMLVELHVALACHQ